MSSTTGGAGAGARHRPEHAMMVEEGREAEETVEEDELAWSDSARASVAAHVSAALMSSTVIAMSEAWRPWAWASLFVYGSLTAATQRTRRTLAPVAQVCLAAVGSTGFAACSRSARNRAWPLAAVAVYASEAVLWRGQTTDLISLAFPRFQRILFVVIVVATLWIMPLVYAAAEKLETDAATVAVDPRLIDATPDGFFRQFAAVLLYGGTFFLCSLSAAVWLRLYRVAPELFRLLLIVALVGATVGLTLRFALHEPDGAMLTGASAASFVAMSFCILYDKLASQLIAALAASLYLASRLLTRPNFAALCWFVCLATKLFFAFQLHLLGSRRPRHLPRLDAWPDTAPLLFPPSAL